MALVEVPPVEGWFEKEDGRSFDVVYQLAGNKVVSFCKAVVGHRIEQGTAWFVCVKAKMWKRTAPNQYAVLATFEPEKG